MRRHTRIRIPTGGKTPVQRSSISVRLSLAIRFHGRLRFHSTPMNEQNKGATAAAEWNGWGGVWAPVGTRICLQERRREDKRGDVLSRTAVAVGVAVASAGTLPGISWPFWTYRPSASFVLNKAKQKQRELRSSEQNMIHAVRFCFMRMTCAGLFQHKGGCV